MATCSSAARRSACEASAAVPHCGKRAKRANGAVPSRRLRAVAMSCSVRAHLPISAERGGASAHSGVGRASHRGHQSSHHPLMITAIGAAIISLWSRPSSAADGRLHQSSHPPLASQVLRGHHVLGVDRAEEAPLRLPQTESVLEEHADGVGGGGSRGGVCGGH